MLQDVADKLKVRVPSLYNHIEDRGALLLEVANLIWSEASISNVPAETNDLKDALVTLCVDVRAAILRHPNAAPLLLEVLPRYLFTDRYERWLGLFNENDIPVERQLSLLDGLETLTHGSALLDAAAIISGESSFPPTDPDEFPNLSRALAAADERDRRFERTVRDYVDGALAPPKSVEKKRTASRADSPGGTRPKRRS